MSKMLLWLVMCLLLATIAQAAVPTHTTPVLNSSDNPLNRSAANLTVYSQNVADGDGDNLSYVFDWRLSGTSIAVLNLAFNTNVSTTSSGAIADYSTIGANGTLGNGTAANAPVWINDSVSGGAYVFDGIDDYIIFPYDESHNLTEFTLSVWIETGSTDRGDIIHRFAGAPSFAGYALVMNPDFGACNVAGSIGLWVGDTAYVCASTAAVNDNTWHHVVGVYNGSDGSIYIDGQLNYTETRSSNLSTDTAVEIGRDREQMSIYFNGSIDAVQIFSRALSAEQILQLYNDQSTNANTSGLVSNETEVGDTWTVALTVSDGLSDSSTLVSNSLEVLEANFAPTHTTPVLNSSDNPLNKTSANLTVYPQNASDLDGDPILFTYDWRLNGNSIAIFNAPFNINESGNQSNVTDLSLFSNNITINGANVSWNDSCVVGGCYNFPGDDENMLERSFPQNGQSFTALTTAFWFNAKSWGGTLVKSSDCGGCADGRRYVISLTGSSNLRTEFLDDNSANIGGWSTDQWYHVVYVYNGSEGATSLYRDGVLVGSDSSLDSSIDLSSDELVIGRGFNGSIDEFKVFNRSLSPEQAMQLFEEGNASLFGSSLNTSTLVANETADNDVFSACVIPSDGTTYGSTLCSSTITIQDTLPSISDLSINSGSGLNYSVDDLYCNATISDAGDDDLNVSIEWYNNGTLALSQDFNNSYSSGTYFSTILDSGNISATENWLCSMRLSDSSGSGNWTNSSNITIVAGPVLNVTLLYPTGDISVDQNSWFNISVNISCDSGNCSNVTAILDPPANWWNASWNKRVSIVINSSKVATDVTDFPVYINLSDLVDSQIFSHTKDDGSDIRAVDNNGNQLAREVVMFNATQEIGEVHVKANLSSSTNTTIWLYFNNSAASEPDWTSAYGKASVWDNGFVAVWHLQESAPSETYANDSLLANNATFDGLTSETSISAKMGRGLDLDGTGDYLDPPLNNGLDITGQNLTLTGWARTPIGGVDDDEALINKISGTGYPYMLGMQDSGGAQDETNCRVATAGGTSQINVEAVPRGEWVFLACTYNGSVLESFVNAVSIATDDSFSGNITSGTDVYLGRRSNSRRYEGDMDELRIANVTRSSGWITTEFNNQNDSSSFYRMSTSDSYDTKGIVPTLEGSVPFWTNFSANPYTFELGTSSQVLTYWVNATGDKGSVWEFFVSANMVVPTTVNDESIRFNLSIRSDVNVAPTHATPVVNASNSTNTTNENLTAYAQSLFDFESDPIATNYDWRLEGTSIAVINMPFNLNVSTNDSAAVPDYSSFTNNATLGEDNLGLAPTWNSSGFYGGAYTFDGINDTIYFPSSNSLNDLAEMTIVAWIYPTETGSTQRIAGKSSSVAANRGWILDLGTAGRVQFDVDFGSSGSDENLEKESVNSVVSFYSWSHLAIAWNGSADNASVRIYVNGSEVSYISEQDGNGSRFSDASQNIRLGRARQETNRPYNGSIDEFMLFNKSLSSDQIREMFLQDQENRSYDTLLSNETTLGENWSVQVVPSDGADDGTPRISATLEIIELQNSSSSNSSNSSNSSSESSSTTESTTTTARRVYGGAAPTPSPGSSVRVFSFLRSGVEQNIKVASPEHALSEITFTPSSDSGRTVFKVNNIDPPKWIAGPVYSAIEVSSGDVSLEQPAVVSLAVPVSWLEEQSAEVKNIRVHSGNAILRQVPITSSSVEGDTVHITVQADTLGKFVVSVSAPSLANNAPSDEEEKEDTKVSPSTAPSQEVSEESPSTAPQEVNSLVTEKSSLLKPLLIVAGIFMFICFIAFGVSFERSKKELVPVQKLPMQQEKKSTNTLLVKEKKTRKKPSKKAPSKSKNNSTKNKSKSSSKPRKKTTKKK